MSTPKNAETKTPLNKSKSHGTESIRDQIPEYKDAEFLKKFLNEQGKILPRRLTGTSQKFQKKVATAVKRARHLAILPFVTDMFK